MGHHKFHKGASVLSVTVFSLNINEIVNHAESGILYFPCVDDLSLPTGRRLLSSLYLSLLETFQGRENEDYVNEKYFASV